MPPSPGLFIGVMHTPVFDVHSFHLCLTLHTLFLVAPCLHLLGKPLEHIPVVVPFVGLVLGLLLTPNVDKVPHLPVVPVV